MENIGLLRAPFAGSRVAMASVCLGLFLAGGSSAFGQTVTEFESGATGWIESANGHIGFAFDTFFPGVEGQNEDLSGPTAEIDFGDTILTITRYGGEGAIRDTSGLGQISDAVLRWNDIVTQRWVFSTPVFSFYTFYGSLETYQTVTVELYSNDQLVDVISRSGGGGGIYAVGHGFTSATPIDRLDFTITGEETTALIGAFVGVYGTESDLGTVYIDGYHGPNGSDVQIDVAFSLKPPPAFALDAGNLFAGSEAQFSVTGARANEQTWLAYSLAGEGETYIPQLDVMLQLTRPKQVGRPIRTNSSGNGSWILPIPEAAGGLDIWFQATQYGGTSQVIGTTIQ